MGNQTKVTHIVAQWFVHYAAAAYMATALKPISFLHDEFRRR